MGMNYTVRPGTIDDIPDVHALVVALAHYEKAPEAVVTTPEQYRRDYEAGRFELLIAEDATTGEVVGMMLFFEAYSTWKGRMIYLDDFVVRESLRRRGIGKLLYDALMKLCRERGVALAKWQVLDWNEPAIAFYRKQNAEIEPGWYNVKRYVE